MKKLLLITASLYASQMLYAQIPVAYYPFSGNANDAIGVLNGTVNGATLTTDRFGNVNSAYSFDGINDRINASLATTIVDNFSLEGWAKISNLTSDNQIIFHNGNSFLNGWGLLISSTGSLVIIYGAVSYTTVPFQCSLNQWYHFALVRANGITKAYANGAEVFNSNIASPNTPTNNFCIGNMSTGTNFLNGVIDEVKIYNTALTAQQINDLYIKGEICNGFDDDNDGLIDEACIPIVSIEGKNINEGNSDTTELKLTVTLDHPFDSTVTVKYKTRNNTATAGSDYAEASDKVKFKPGQISKKITIAILGDVTVEQNEDLYVILSNPVNALLGNDTAIVKIKNDDASFTGKSNKIKNDLSIKLSPNPAKDILTVSGIKTLNGLIEITSLQGYVLLRQNISSDRATINISKLQQGIYMLRYIVQNEIKTVQFVKE